MTEKTCQHCGKEIEKLEAQNTEKDSIIYNLRSDIEDLEDERDELKKRTTD